MLYKEVQDEITSTVHQLSSQFDQPVECLECGRRFQIEKEKEGRRNAWKKEGSQFMNSVRQFNVTSARDGSEVMVASLSMPAGTQEKNSVASFPLIGCCVTRSWQQVNKTRQEKTMGQHRLVKR